MTTTAMLINDFVLPWEATRKEDERFRKTLKRLLLLFLLLAVVFPWLPLPEIEREQAEILPPTLAKIVLHHRLPAPPPAPKPEPVEIEKPAETEKPVKKTAPPAKKKAARAKKKVASMGVAAFSNQLQSLRSSLDVAKLQARNTNVATGASAKATRSVLGRNSAVKTSGGVSSSAMNSTGSGTQLGGRNGVAVASTLGGGDGTGGGGYGDGSGGGGGGNHHSSVPGGRDMESIRRVFERHKGAIYAIYNRALRRDPVIRGKYVFHIVIEPSGAISAIKLVSSELENGKLEKKLLTRIRVIDFGSEDVLATPVNYKFDFLPS